MTAKADRATKAKAKRRAWIPTRPTVRFPQTRLEALERLEDAAIALVDAAEAARAVHSDNASVLQAHVAWTRADLAFVQAVKWIRPFHDDQLGEREDGR